MEPSIRISRAERTGGALGRLWKKGACLDRKACESLIIRGAPAALASAVLWIVKLLVLGVLFYAVFWVGLVLVIAVIVAELVRHSDFAKTPEPEWKNGSAGFGLYTYDGYRIDPHVYDDD